MEFKNNSIKNKAFWIDFCWSVEPNLNLNMQNFKVVLSFLVGCFFYIQSSFAQQSEIKNIDSAIVSGNAKAIAQYFSNSITLNILGKENVYSKTQAEQILKDYLSKNNCSNYQLKHQGNSRDKSVYVIGAFNNNENNYRTYYFLRKEGESYKIKELKIEKE
ncbi:MAG: DUF4783 domain-containing protein [Cyclobacteriaceae bacterium]|nr:DUF4783 domain-containing protein [Cyclobacteriaceae bacterium]